MKLTILPSRNQTEKKYRHNRHPLRVKTAEKSDKKKIIKDWPTGLHPTENKKQTIKYRQKEQLADNAKTPLMEGKKKTLELAQPWYGLIVGP
jgi:hypothetical protein